MNPILNPAFFDIFGFMGFIILFISSIVMLTEKKFPVFIKYIILAISILGLIIDGYIVTTTYILP